MPTGYVRISPHEPIGSGLRPPTQRMWVSATVRRGSREVVSIALKTAVKNIRLVRSACRTPKNRGDTSGTGLDRADLDWLNQGRPRPGSHDMATVTGEGR